MSVVYRTSGAWGAGKGSVLLPTEVDNNFFQLMTRIAALQTNPAQPVNIASFTVTGSSFSVNLTDGTSKGPFTLPVAVFKWRGAWQPDTAYNAMDLLYLDNLGLYIVLQGFTSGSSFVPTLSLNSSACLTQVMGFPTLYDLGFYIPGIPGQGVASGAPMFQFVASRPCYIPASSEADDAGQVYLQTPPSAQLSCTIGAGSSNNVGSVVIPSGSNAGYITLHSAVSLSAGEVLAVYPPASPSGAGLSVTLTMLRGASS
jgi:hypothetical protein